MDEPHARPVSRTVLGFEIAAVVCLFALEPFFQALVAYLSEPGEHTDTSVALDQTWLVVRGIAVSVPVLYLMLRSGKGWAYYGFKQPRFLDVWGGALLYVAYVVLVYVFWAVALAIVGPAVNEDAEYLSDAFPEETLTAATTFLIIAGSVATGFAEELAARAYLIPRLTEWLGSRVGAVVLAAVVFASFHIYQGVWSTTVIFGFALLYGTLFVLIRRIWPFVLGHALTNAITFLS